MPANCDCGGSGFLPVGEGYADRVLPRPPLPYPVPDNPHQQAINRQSEAAYEATRAALLNSVYPCPDCSPVQFLAWRDGEWPYKRDDPNRPRATPPPPAPRLPVPDERLPYRDRD